MLRPVEGTALFLQTGSGRLLEQNTGVLKISLLELRLYIMAEDAEVGLFSRTERKALEREKILQRERERKILRLVRRPKTHISTCPGLAACL